MPTAGPIVKERIDMLVPSCGRYVTAMVLKLDAYIGADVFAASLTFTGKASKLSALKRREEIYAIQ